MKTAQIIDGGENIKTCNTDWFWVETNILIQNAWRFEANINSAVVRILREKGEGEIITMFDEKNNSYL
jgi:hypothetical protein